MRTATLIFTLCVVSIQHLIAQNDPEVEILKSFSEKLKKENGKVGIWSTDQEKWLIPAEYEKLTGSKLKAGSSWLDCASFIKAWKGDKFDLYERSQVKYTTEKKFEIRLLVRDAQEIVQFFPEDVSSCQLPALFYRMGSKWGWFVKEVGLSRYADGRASVVISDGLVEPRFDKVTLKQTVYGSNNHLIEIDSAGEKGLYNSSGERLVRPGPFTGFEMKGNQVIIQGRNGLKGYAFKGHRTEASYTGFEDTSIMDNGTMRFFTIGLLPDGTRHYIEDGLIVPKSELDGIESRRQMNELGLREVQFPGFVMNVYKGWMTEEKSKSTDFSVELRKGTFAETMTNAPSSWIATDGLNGKLYFSAEELPSTFAAQRNELVQFYAYESLMVKNAFNNADYKPTDAELSKAKASIKLIEEQVVLKDGRKGNIMFYAAPGYGVSLQLDCILVVAAKTDATKVNKYAIKVEGEPLGGFDENLTASSFQEWKNYFKNVLTTVR